MTVFEGPCLAGVRPAVSVVVGYMRMLCWLAGAVARGVVRTLGYR